MRALAVVALALWAGCSADDGTSETLATTGTVPSVTGTSGFSGSGSGELGASSGTGAGTVGAATSGVVREPPALDAAADASLDPTLDAAAEASLDAAVEGPADAAPDAPSAEASAPSGCGTGGDGSTPSPFGCAFAWGRDDPGATALLARMVAMLTELSH